MKYIVPTCLFLIALNAGALFSQSMPVSPNRIGPGGLREGPWTVYLDMDWKPVTQAGDASYYRIITYRNGKPEGIVRTYTRLGRLRFEGFLTSEEPIRYGDGKAVFYDDFGKKSSEGAFLNGKKDGPWQEWFDDGEYARGSYVNGLPQGTWSFFTAEGMRLATGNYKDGERDGLWVETDPDGTHREGIYRTGKYEGLWTFYHANGQKESEGLYTDGKPEGLWTFWDNTGKELGKARYRGGERIE